MIRFFTGFIRVEHLSSSTSQTQQTAFQNDRFIQRRVGSFSSSRFDALPRCDFLFLSSGTNDEIRSDRNARKTNFLIRDEFELRHSIVSLKNFIFNNERLCRSSSLDEKQISFAEDRTSLFVRQVSICAVRIQINPSNVSISTENKLSICFVRLKSLEMPNSSITVNPQSSLWQEDQPISNDDESSTERERSTFFERHCPCIQGFIYGSLVVTLVLAVFLTLWLTGKKTSNTKGLVRSSVALLFSHRNEHRFASTLETDVFTTLTTTTVSTSTTTSRKYCSLINRFDSSFLSVGNVDFRCRLVMELDRRNDPRSRRQCRIVEQRIERTVEFVHRSD